MFTFRASTMTYILKKHNKKRDLLLTLKAFNKMVLKSIKNMSVMRLQVKIG